MPTSPKRIIHKGAIWLLVIALLISALITPYGETEHGSGQSKIRTFTDDNSVFSNPDRGAVVTEQNALREVSSVSGISGGQHQVNFYANPHLHKTGGEVEWYSPSGNFTTPKGTAVVSGWSGNGDIHITDVKGELPRQGDYFKNYFGDNSLYFFRMTWKQVEPSKGVYDFSHVTNNPNYKFAKAQGMKFVYRLNMNWPNTSGAPGEIDIPQWLYNEINGDGTWYSISYHDDVDSAWVFSPNYANGLLIKYHKDLIRAISNQFKRDTLHAQIGSLGHWGELHGHMPDESVQRQYYQHYVDAFGRDKVSMRRNMNFMRENNIPVYYDMLGHPLHLGGQWNQWWGLIHEMEGYTDSNGISHAPYTNFRTAGPIGGEHSPWNDNQPYLYDYSNQSSGRTYSRTLAMAKDLEMSYVYMITPSFGLQDTSRLAFQNNVDDFMRRLGYRFYISEASYNKKPTDLDIFITFKNAGIARSYSDYPVYINFYDENDRIISRQNLNIPLTQIPREEQREYQRTVANYPKYTRFGIEIEGVTMPMKSHEIEAGVYEIGHIRDTLSGSQPQPQQPSGGSAEYENNNRSGSQPQSTQADAGTEQAPATPKANGVSFTIDASTYSVDGEHQLMDAAPYIKEGRMMIPVRHLETLFGVKPIWNNLERSVSISFGGMNYKVVIGSNLLTVNNAPLMELDVSAEILRSRTFVPASRFAKAMGIEYKYDERTRTATFI